VDEAGKGRGEGYAVNIPLRPRTDDETYLWVFRELVPPLVRRYDPDVLVTQLGVDTHYEDPLTFLTVSTHGHEALVQEFAALATMPWLACGGGGYDLDVVPRSWTLAFGVMSEQTFDDELPAAYRERYGGRWLHDRDIPTLGEMTKARVRSHAEEIVAAVKARHGLA
jgi:acetoin utilization protein AcuC